VPVCAAALVLEHQAVMQIESINKAKRLRLPRLHPLFIMEILPEEIFTGSNEIHVFEYVTANQDRITHEIKFRM
jgi:hypothetical protein